VKARGRVKKSSHAEGRLTRGNMGRGDGEIKSRGTKSSEKKSGIRGRNRMTIGKQGKGAKGAKTESGRGQRGGTSTGVSWEVKNSE